VAALVALFTPAARGAQSPTINTAGGALRVQAPTFVFLDGQTLESLRDGRAVRMQIELSVLSQSGGVAIAQSRADFNISFDLWEERFAVTREGAPPRSVSHLTRKDSEAWCLEQLSVPMADLRGLGRTAPFWVRLLSRVQNPPDPAEADGESAFTLNKLVDVLSRKRRDGQPNKSMEAGPFRLTN
jgi:hypothetical protein